MSRICRYQDSVSRFIKTKSCYSDTIKNNASIDAILNLNDHVSSIILLTILNGQYKKKNLKSHHGYYMASGIDLMMSVAYLYNNLKYFEIKYGKDIIRNFVTQVPIYVFECLSQNVEILENITEKEKVLKINRKITTYVHKKLLDLVKMEVYEGDELVNKCDVMKHKFTDKTNVENKYKKIKKLDKDILMDYTDKKFGSVCQCAFVIGWLFGLGDEKMIGNFEKLGSHLGILIKLSNDFKNLERDILNADKSSLNLIVNLGIHECFSLFDESKLKLLEGCLTLDVYSITIKEVIDYVEKTFDTYLKNSDLDLKSQYSSENDNEKK